MNTINEIKLKIDNENDKHVLYQSYIAVHLVRENLYYPSIHLAEYI